MNKTFYLPEEIEQSLIAYILLVEQDQQKIIPFLEKEDFYSKRISIIFEAINDLFFSSKKVNTITVLSQLHDTNKLQAIGGASFLSEITINVPVYSTIKEIMTNLIEKSNLRKAQMAIQYTMSQLNESDKKTDDILNDFEAKMVQISRGVQIHDFKEMKEVAAEILKDLLSRKNISSLKGVSTGFRELDKITSGLQKGDLIILAARPAMGKTAFALNLTKNIVENNNHIAVFFSLEMPTTQLVTRILSAETGIRADHLKNPHMLTNHDWVNISTTLNEKIGHYNLFIDDSAGMKLHEMIWKTKKLLQKMKKIDLIVVDYLQLIDVGSGGQNRQVEVSKISRTLKQLAREINCPVIALSQLSREVEKREDKKPLISDLRESGAIEQDADIVAFLYRENYYKKEISPYDIQETKLIIAKHRNGAIGEISLQFNPKIGLFFEEGEQN
ncbi:replicative DNA helicase [Mesomycoplasma lagogenitalium]|uniref:Replicative DNA helicase n=1 Tax=Mesomycoplasma lagogenitalium TaxID=171286 RepID=A0ABY8LU81_9BACT|nr:replicative DNA helicase [Mesomycoplasma lagogenitalium]WGI36803.1 replicative DNA helicase [Mesomycoplasma lagogenitalium]